MIANIFGPEIWILLLIALILFGGRRLPELARALGKSVNEFKRGMANLEEEIEKPVDADKKPDAPKT